MKKYKILILGTRGIPGKQGRLEIFAERLALYLEKKGWKVTIYCQDNRKNLSYSIWQGINLVHVPVPKNNSFWSILFDFKSGFHALQQEGLILTLGYNAAVFSILYYLKKRVNITSISTIEWWEEKWNALERSWLYINERCAVWFSNYLIVDHAKIKHYLCTEVKTNKPISLIPYNMRVIGETDKDLEAHEELFMNLIDNRKQL